MALRTTQRLLAPSERTMGNSILQSGAAIGSIFTPLIILAFLHTSATWRAPFWCVGVWRTLGGGLAADRAQRRFIADHASRTGTSTACSSKRALLTIVTDRRFWALICLVVAINAAWHFFRAWMPLYLQTARGYADEEVSWFSMGYYIAADLGAMAAGFATLLLIRRGGEVHASRLRVYLAFALLGC